MKKNTILLAILFITIISFSQTIIMSENFDAGVLPVGWEAGDFYGDGDTIWTFGSNVVPGNEIDDFTTNAVIFNDDAAGNDDQHDFVYLWYGAVNVSTFTNVTLSYDYALNAFDDDLLHISLWDNLNSVWIPITTYSEDTNPTRGSINISEALIANPGVDPEFLYFGFGFDDVDSSWGWGSGIDNVVLSGNELLGNNDAMFTHIATASNINGSYTVLDHALLNNKPNAKIVVSHNLQYFEGNFSASAKTIGVAYTGVNWIIYNENQSVFREGSGYNIYIGGDNSNTITHIANEANQGINLAQTVIDNPAVNGNPNAIIVIGKYYDPNFVFNIDHYGLFYDGANWIIYNEGNNPIPTDAAFNVVLNPSGIEVQAYQHQATAANTEQYWTIIDNPLTNANPNAVISFTRNWGASGDVSNVTLNQTQNLWYGSETQKWMIINVDLSDIDENVKFNILVAENDGTVSVNDNELTNFTMYPNPVKDNLIVDSQEQIIKVEVYNLLGQQIKSLNPKATNFTIDLSELNTGIYMVKFISNDKQTSKKIIKS